jgi:hypothetical protein
MVYTPMLLSMLFVWLLPGADLERRVPAMPPASPSASMAAAAGNLFNQIGLEGEMDETVFAAGYTRMQQHGTSSTVVAIADMTQASSAKRLYIIDLEKKQLIMRTYVAHGQGSGDSMATSFSNREGSHQTSLGLYRVGAEIISPKHGPALLLEGLERGINCKAMQREVIMHGADYVSEQFIAEHGRLGRSWGCPAVSRYEMPRMLELLANGALLYVHGKQ